MWPISSSSSSSSRVAGPSSVPPPLGYGLPPELGMFVVTPAAAFHHHHHHTDPSSLIPSADLAASTALGVGVIPLLTAAPCLNNNNNAAGGGGGIDDGDFRGLGGGANRSIHLWQAQDHQHQHEVNYLKSKAGSISFDHHTVPDNLLDGGIGCGGLGAGAGGIGGGGPAMTCQDCGNQAKKDCSHRRCRTCCRSRGFDCSTHVRSTWVPAARRRERQMLSSSSKGGGGGGDRTSSGSTSGAKKPRLITSQNTTTTSHTSISNTPPRSYDTTSSHQDPNLKDSLPGLVCAPAVFKCVRVTAVEDGGEDEYAYQAVVRIGGHIFKGFLYDQGVESRGGCSGGGDGNFPNLSELHLGAGRNGGGASSSSPIIDPTTTDVYGAGSVTGLGGTGYGNTIT